MALGPFTFAELARVAGVRLRDAQLYRKSGLLQPPRRPPGRSADVAFHDEHVKRLRFIKNARGYGFTLEDIAQLVDPRAVTSCADVYRLTSRRLEAMIQADASDISRIVALDTLLTSCLATGSRGDCQILATLGIDAPSYTNPAPIDGRPERRRSARSSD
jgi:MerR family transcriptional regulator, mercuric resistance operon regulatory protein